DIETRIRNTFRSCGFSEIETPTLEYYDAFSPESGLVSQETMFKFFDQQGRILVMRPDATIPAARVAATKLSDCALPLRISYICNTFRYNELGGGKLKEFTAAGVEIMGEDNADADAEVIAAAINLITGLGIESFQIDIGQMQFFKGIMEESALSESNAEKIRVMIDRKDFIGLEDMVKERGLDKNLQKLILGLSGFYGGIDMIEKLSGLTRNARARKALENLEQVYAILKDYGMEKYVSIDLGMLQNPNFYTGVIFKGYTHDIGFPVLRGGRYDGLVGKFGRKLSATGFSLGVNMLMTALERQGLIGKKPVTDTIISFSEDARAKAYKICAELRSQGLAVEVDIMRKGRAAVEAYAKKKNIGGYIYVNNDDTVEVCDLETGEKNMLDAEKYLKSL
ncbi:MAG: ATP phosphoribosyltransferase regulatory subunit, partial [Eubacteriales bacterium]|nr:ATP phosphoribosyltransferase regulatory subunit [Eubacteriales bacterium]